MKKIYLTTILSVFTVLGLFAQTPCDAGRYSTDMFSVTTTSAVNFGSNTTFSGANMDLYLDVYEPTGDTETARPLIVWAHGGSFIGGTRTDSDVVTLSNSFAQKGFVCASIDYRTGMWPIDSVNSIKAVLRAVQDMKAAVRFFYKDRATTDTYKIDTTKIFIAGSSAGAITALHYAYLDQECEIEPYMPIPTLNSLGGLDGTSGNPGYSDDIVGVINLCGALASYGWIEAGDVPVCSMHGDNDGTVPYNRGIANVSGFPIMYLDGSRMIYEQCMTIGVPNNTYTHYGGNHAVYIGSAQYMDTTINFVRDFTIGVLGCTEPALQAPNTPSQTSNLYTLGYCGLSILEEGALIANIYPNPSKDRINVEFASDETISYLELTDLSGRVIQHIDSPSQSIVLRRQGLNAGTYFIRALNNKGSFSSSKIVFQ